MAGEAKTNAFMLGTATVMLGAPADLFNLTPAANSIGLTKNFKLDASATYIKLGQGIQNKTVHSTKTGNDIMATMEAYEYTAKNLTYALGLDGYNAGAAITASTTVSVVTSSTVFSVLSAAGLVVGRYITLQTGYQDQVVVRKITAIAGVSITVDLPVAGLAIGQTVSACNLIPIGSDKDDVFLSAYVVGTLADKSEVGILLPKVKVTKGFSLLFGSTDYQNLPLELTIYDQIPADPHYARFQADFGGAPAAIVTRT